MAKNKKLLIILLCVLVAAVAAYIIALNLGKNTVEEEPGDAIGDLTGSLGKVTLTSNGETNSFTYDEADEAWHWDEDYDYPMKSMYLNLIFNKMKSLTSSRTFEAQESVAHFGLEEPRYSVAAVDSEGKSLSLLVGNELDEDRVYAMEKGGRTIYIVSTEFADTLDKTLLDMALVDSIPELTANQVKSLTVTTDAGTVTLDSSDRSAYTVLGYAGELKTETAADWKPTEDKLAEYGLTEPYAVITVSYDKDGTQGEYTLTCGNTDESGNYRYCIVDDSDMVVLSRTTFIDRVIANV